MQEIDRFNEAEMLSVMGLPLHEALAHVDLDLRRYNYLYKEKYRVKSTILSGFINLFCPPKHRSWRK
jgi:hypothetical protein